MINISAEYKTAILNNRLLHHEAVIEFVDGTTLTPKDIDLYTFKIAENTSNQDNFDIGAVIAKQLNLKINNIDGKYGDHKFSGARITARVGLEISGKTEWLKKGVYYAEPGSFSGDTISVTAYDNIMKFDMSYSKSKLKYPATLGEIVRDACSVCDVTMSADLAVFPQNSFIVQSRPSDSSLTFRQVLRYVGEISCLFFRMNEDDQLTASWYDTDLLESEQVEETAVKIEHYTGKIETDDVVVTGIRVIEDTSDSETIYDYGTTGYVLKIKENKLIQNGKGASVAEYVGTKVNGLIFRPLSIKCQGDPAREAGDIAVVIDRKGNRYKTILTGVTYTAKAQQDLLCGAESPVQQSATRYSKATQVYRELRNTLRQQHSEFTKALETLQDAMNEKEGLYPITEELEDGSRVLYFCDRKTLEESKVVIKLNAKGWGMSTDGGKTWNAGTLVDGTTITKILNAIGINADWINAGAFTVKDPDGNIMFRADTATGHVDIIANSFQLKGKTLEEITEETAKNYVTSVIGDAVKDINTQYFDSYDPALTNKPASEWIDTDTRDKHLDDIFYNTTTKKMFRFVKTDDTYSWENFDNPDIKAALDAASAAQNTADGKRRVFLVTPTVPYNAGDMWTTSTDDGKGEIKICKTSRQSGVFSSADWISPSYVDSDDVDNAINEYDTSLGQPEIFNKLTNNEKNKGIYIQNGELYINASYILSGVLAGKLINGKGLNVTDKNGQVTLKIDDDGNVYIKATEFSLEGKNISDVVAAESDKFRTLNVILSNEYQGIPTDKDGKYTSFPSCSTTVKVLYGTEDVTKSSIIQWSSSSGVYGSSSGETYTVSGLSTDTGTVKVTVTRGSLTAEKIFTIAKQKQGIQGEQGQTGETGATGATGNGISSITTYYLATASSSGVYTSTSGWTTSVQSPTNSKPYLWSYQTTYYTNGTSSSTSPHIIGVRGANGEDGKDAGELTQEQIFNILTNNGQTQGIYLQNGKVYINGSYIKSKSISAGMLSVTDLYSIGAKIGGWTINSSYLQSSGDAIKLYSSGTIQVGNATIKSESNAMVIRSGLKIYCGTSSISDGTDRIMFYNLTHVTSGGHMVFANDGATVAYLSSSSKRYKDHVSDMTIEEAEKILNIPVIWFKYKKGYLDESDWLNGKQLPGFYAEDVYDIFPEATQLNEAGEPEDWNFRVMIPTMMKVIQNQNERINTLEDTVNTLNERLNKLEEMLKGVVK